jgi:cellulose synthase/poly-beta-1,6-N-acetylglucosamine synthase-like glycosyltransferase
MSGRRATGLGLALFWSAVGTLGYTYVAFPVAVFVRGLVGRRPHQTGDGTPRVTVVVAAHNEAGVIGSKLDNLLAVDYPSDRFEVIVASDGSDDGTNEVVAGFAERGVRLLALPRVGKASALNEAVAVASGEIVVFSDANTLYATDAITALVRPFADPEVGGVAGDQRYVRNSVMAVSATGEEHYWNFDRLLKISESRAGHVISATGAIYAVRRELIDHVPDGVTDDFFISTGVIAHGKRLIFAPHAVAYEPVAATSKVELSRKVRVITRGLRAVAVRRVLLDPRQHGFYAIQLFSHKVLRRLMAFPLIGVAVSSLLLWRRGRLYRAATVAQAAFYAAAGLGLWRKTTSSRDGVSRILALPAYFVLVNVACLRAVWNLLRGTRIDRWEPQR